MSKERVSANLLASAVRWGSYLLILLPGILSIAYVHQFGVNVIFRDQWEMVSKFGLLSAGTLSFWELWEPHNVHRFLFPRIAMLALGTITEWNSVAEMYLILLCLFVTLGVLWLAFGTGYRWGPLLFVPVAFMVFTLNQSENMLWGYQITFAFTQTFSVLALYLLHLSGRGGKWQFAVPVALASGIVAAFSAIQGLLVWPAGLLQILISPLERRAKRVLAAAWSLTGIVVWVVFFVDYEPRGEATSSPFGLLTNPAAGAERFLSLLGNSLFLGNPLFGQRAFALANGLLLVGLAVVGLRLVYKDRKLGRYSFWVSLLAFSFLVLLSITAGRNESQVMAERFVTFSILVTISVYIVLAKLWTERKTRITSALLGVLLMVVLLNIPLSYKMGIEEGAQTKMEREEEALVLYTYESQSVEDLRILRRQNPESVRQLAPILENRGYNAFSESRTRAEITKD